MLRGREVDPPNNDDALARKSSLRRAIVARYSDDWEAATWVELFLTSCAQLGGYDGFLSEYVG